MPAVFAGPSREDADPVRHLLPPSAMMLVQAMTAMALVAVPVLAPEIAAALDLGTAALAIRPRRRVGPGDRPLSLPVHPPSPPAG